MKEYLAALEAEAEPNLDRKPPKIISPSDPRRQVLFIGDDVGRDHGFAMPRSDGVENAVDKGDAEQFPDRGAILFARPDEARQRTVEGGLFGKNPAREPRCGHVGCGMGRTKRRAPRRHDTRYTGENDRHEDD